MSEAAEKLKPLLAALTADERAELVEFLLTLNGDGEEEEELTQEEWEEAWAEEVNRRMADSKAGKTVPIPHEEVRRQMKEKFEAELDRRCDEHESGADPGVLAEDFFRELKQNRS